MVSYVHFLEENGPQKLESSLMNTRGFIRPIYGDVVDGFNQVCLFAILKKVHDKGFGADAAATKFLEKSLQVVNCPDVDWRPHKKLVLHSSELWVKNLFNNKKLKWMVLNGEFIDMKEAIFFDRTNEVFDSLYDLIAAVSKGDVARVSLFLELGADPNTILHLAAKESFTVLQGLFKHPGVNKRTRGGNGECLLHSYLCGTKPPIMTEIRAILDFTDMCIDAPDDFGKTALFQTLRLFLSATPQQNYMWLFRFLLDKGADPLRYCVDGSTPFHWALQLDNWEVIVACFSKMAPAIQGRFLIEFQNDASFWQHGMGGLKQIRLNILREVNTQTFLQFCTLDVSDREDD